MPSGMLDRPPLHDMEATWTLVIDSDRVAATTGVAHLDSHAIVAGSFSGALTLGTRTLRADGPGDSFVARIDQAGQVVWARQLGGSGQDAASAVATGPAHGIAVSLEDSAPGPSESTILMLDERGNSAWQITLAATRYVHVAALDMAQDNSLIAAGTFTGTMSMGDQVLTSAGQSDAFIARVDPDGRLLWAVRAGGAGADAANAVAVQRDLITAVGVFSNQADFGPHPIRASASTVRGRPAQDAYVTALAMDGRFVWVRPLGQSSAEMGLAVAADESGMIYAAGAFGQTMSVDGLQLAGRGLTDAFVIAFDAGGRARWASSIGGPGSDHAHALAVSRRGVVVAGTFEARARAGSIDLASAGAHDIFVAEIDRSGQLRWARGMGGTGHDAVTAVRISPSGTASITGNFESPMNIGSSMVRAAGVHSGFVARFAM